MTSEDTKALLKDIDAHAERLMFVVEVDVAAVDIKDVGADSGQGFQISNQAQEAVGVE